MPQRNFVTREPGALAKLLAIPVFFLAGMAVTVLVRPVRERPCVALARSLVVECLLLIGFLAACLVGVPFRGPDAPGAIVALLFGMAAMGAKPSFVGAASMSCCAPSSHPDQFNF